MVSMAGSLHLLIQLMSSQSPCFLLTISWILVLKKDCFVVLTMLLNLFQFSRFLVTLYLFSAHLHSLFHQLLECFVMLTCFEFILHPYSIFNARKLVVSSSLIGSDMSEMSTLFIVCLTSLMKLTSSSLFFAMEYLNELISVTIDTSWMQHGLGSRVWRQQSAAPK